MILLKRLIFNTLMTMAADLCSETGVRRSWMMAPVATLVAASLQVGIPPGAVASQVPGSQVPDGQEPPAVFHSGVELVSVAATVRDRRGRMVRNLVASDFEVRVQGRATPIVSFEAASDAPISVALLVDGSGSMQGSAHLEAARQVVDHLLSWFDTTADEAAVFTFDRDLYQVESFTKDPARVRAAMGKVEAFGMTSLFDAVGGTARELGRREAKRRAIIVLTDGVDNASEETPATVSAVASAIEVPVYVIAVLSALDNPESPVAVVPASQAPIATDLRNLATWTGGDAFAVSAPAHVSLAVRQLLAELRHQYLLAFESASEPGWHRLDIRTRRSDLTVRARGAYLRTAG
jgi:VWFA-related protein